MKEYYTYKQEYLSTHPDFGQNSSKTTDTSYEALGTFMVSLRNWPFI